MSSYKVGRLVHNKVGGVGQFVDIGVGQLVHSRVDELVHRKVGSNCVLRIEQIGANE